MSGAGISAESGIKTFRDAGGLWEGHDVMAVASIEGYRRNPALVLQFYNERRKQLLKCEPNNAHLLLKELESIFEVTIVTQNVDDLHERAGSSKVIHLHGELLKVVSSGSTKQVYPWNSDLNIGDVCSEGFQLRPFIVWFGEEVPMLYKAIEAMEYADLVLIVGTSLQVYPAAGLVSYVRSKVPVYYIDPHPVYNDSISGIQDLMVFEQKATEGMLEFYKLFSADPV